MSDNPAVKMDDIRFSYGPKNPDMHFDCVFDKSVITAIMGASGAGKSTMLSLIAGFEKPKSGAIILNDQDHTHTPPSERPLSMIFQNHNLFAHMSVFDNIGLGISSSLKLPKDGAKRIAQALQTVGLDGFSTRLPSQLSGGERQRVALARILVRNQPMLLLDEAFASLGPGLRAEMLDLVAQLSAQNNLTTLMVTHAPEDAMRIAKNLVFVNDKGVIYSGDVSALENSAINNFGIKEYLGN